MMLTKLAKIYMLEERGEVVKKSNPVKIKMKIDLENLPNNYQSMVMV